MTTDSYTDRFGGIERLYGTTALKRFRESHVAVVGIGGVGSWTVEALARSGVGHLTLVDLDEICITNVNRQLHARDGKIGQLKIDAMAERARGINPDIKLTLVPGFFNKKSAETFFSTHYDTVVDAIDSSLQKAHLVASCHQRNIPIVTCGGAGGRVDPTRLQKDDLAKTFGDSLLLRLRKDLRTHYNFPLAEKDGRKVKKFGITAIFSDETPVFLQCDGSTGPEKPKSNGGARLNCASGFGSSSPVTGSFGLAAASEVLKQLTE